MPFENTKMTYGSISKTLHWMTALLILSAFPLGFVASNLGHEIRSAGGAASPEQIEQVTLLFSLHKTIGVTAFFVALIRIAWVIRQPKPGLLNGDHRYEAILAELVHWLLYGSMVLVPLSGWISHAASTGFAPIWWPLGQDLPGVPKSDTISHIAGAVHEVGKTVLMVAVFLHVAGAIKHVIIDKDTTLRRMLPGQISDQTRITPSDKQPGHILPACLAVVILLIVFGGTAISAVNANSSQVVSNVPAATAQGNWQVQNGALGLTIQQLGNKVEGRFSDWNTDIIYEPGKDGKRGAVTVTIPVASLELGSVSAQALEADFFDAATYPTAILQADLIQQDGSLLANGDLIIKDMTLPLSFPVELHIDGDMAKASGSLQINRLDANIGAGVTDEATLAFLVDVHFDLTAKRTVD